MKFTRLILGVALVVGLFSTASANERATMISKTPQNAFVLSKDGYAASILIDKNDDKGVLRAVNNLKSDIQSVTSNTPAVVDSPSAEQPTYVIVGSIGKSRWIDQLIKSGKIYGKALAGKWEKYTIQTVDNPLPGVKEALVVAGSDKRGTIYGIYEISQQIGVSPWHYWADVPVKKSSSLFITKGSYTEGEPAVKYRGIFLNDEAPALTGWAISNFKGYKHEFYEKVFDLLLRLKANFLWPAMWDAAFYDDDPLNSQLADEYGIVMGTSHHEPMAKAHKEWARYGNKIWNYDKNSAVLDDFWRKGIERMNGKEDLVTIGMRGDGDEPMSEKSNIELLERIVKKQRSIIADVTGKKAEKTPQVWALYKEVQEYYDRGMRVPDDVTLLLCDDNWGNVRKLPELSAPARKGGYGMYYHFDYVGDPRNYKWVNVSQVQRVWEQMNLCYEHGVDRLWIVNVGDLKPMEYPITFFMDMAWNPKAFTPNNLYNHTVNFCRQQLGNEHANECARLINLYTKYNHRVTPELLNENTYSLENYQEFTRVTNEYKDLSLDALRLYHLMPLEYRDTYEQLVLFPIQGCANLYEMYYAVAMNHMLAAKKDTSCNSWAAKVRELYERDSILCQHYNKVMANGKWNHMMDQTHIGYTYWQQPDKNSMPSVITLSGDGGIPSRCYLENDGYVAIEAEHFARKAESQQVKWSIIPCLGKTLSSITTLPSNVVLEKISEPLYLEYDMVLTSSGSAEVQIHASPSLNFNGNRGLRYAISFDGGVEQIVNINKDYTTKQHNDWVANRINVTSTQHQLAAGSHTLRIRPLDSGLVLQRVVVNCGGLKPSYMGPIESATKR